MAVIFRNGNVIVGDGKVIEKGTVAVIGKDYFCWTNEKVTNLKEGYDF